MAGHGNQDEHIDDGSTINVSFEDKSIHRMPVNDYLLLTRYDSPHLLKAIQSEKHFQQFTEFVKKSIEDPSHPSTSTEVSGWKRKFVDDITDWHTANVWVWVAFFTDLPELARICTIRRGEFEALGLGVDYDAVEDDEGGEDDDDGYEYYHGYDGGNDYDHENEEYDEYGYGGGNEYGLREMHHGWYDGGYGGVHEYHDIAAADDTEGIAPAAA